MRPFFADRDRRTLGLNNPIGDTSGQDEIATVEGQNSRGLLGFVWRLRLSSLQPARLHRGQGARRGGAMRGHVDRRTTSSTPPQ